MKPEEIAAHVVHGGSEPPHICIALSAERRWDGLCLPCAETTDALHIYGESEYQRGRVEKDGAYAERNQCVALIVRMALALGWRAGVRDHEDKPGESWEPDWRNLVCIDLPTGQISWHFHDSEKHLLAGLPPYPSPWDGHDTPEKYRRVNAALAAPAEGPSSEYQRGLREAASPAAYCHDCGRALHAEEVHCDDCADDLREDEQSQDGTAPAPKAEGPSSEYQRGRGDALRQAATAAAECKRCNCAERKVRALMATEKEK